MARPFYTHTVAKPHRGLRACPQETAWLNNLNFCGPVLKTGVVACQLRNQPGVLPDLASTWTKGVCRSGTASGQPGVTREHINMCGSLETS